MLRLNPSRLGITSDDIRDLKDRLARRQTQPPEAAKGTDWFTVHAARQSQNKRPSRYDRSILRTGPQRAVGNALMPFDDRHANKYSPSLSTSGSSSGEPSSEAQDSSSNDRLATTTAILTEARQAIDKAALGPPTCSAADPFSSQSSPGSGRFGFSDFAPGGHLSDLAKAHQRLSGHGQGFDGTVEASHSSHRGDESSALQRRSVRTSPSLLEEHTSLRPLPPGSRSLFSAVISLDPQAPTFVPRVRFGSMNNQEVQRRLRLTNSEKSPHHLRSRPATSANSDNRQLNPDGLRMIPPTHSRVSLPIRNVSREGHRMTNIRAPSLSYRGGRQNTPFMPSLGPLEDRYPMKNRALLDPPGLPGFWSSSAASETHEYNAVHDLASTGIDSRFTTPPWPQQNSYMRPRIVSNASYSVPDLVDVATMRVPVVHSRLSSLTWNRNGVNLLSSQSRTTSTNNAPLDEQPYHRSVPFTDAQQSFYLDNSPLDELTDGIRRMSAASSGRRSSGGSNVMRPFRGNLLSGSLFYSEDIFSEDLQSVGEPKQQVARTHRLATNLHVSLPLLASQRGIHNNQSPESAVPQYSSPPLPTMGTPTTISVPQVSSSNYSRSPTEPVDSSPGHLSPITSGHTYSLPISSMTPIGHLASSPPQQNSSNQPALATGAPTGAATPHFHGVDSPLPRTFRSEPRPRNNGTPGFRIYEDCVPAAMQPQTPADILSTRTKDVAEFARDSTPSPLSDRHCDTYRQTLQRSILEPTTAELTAIPFLSPHETARQPGIKYLRPSNDQENEFDASALIGLEGERMASLHRSDFAGVDVLDVTPPHMGRFESLARE